MLMTMSACPSKRTVPSVAFTQCQFLSVKPLAIVFFDRSLVVMAWCELRQDYRSFRIDRIAQLSVTDRSFRPQRVAMLREYLDRLERTLPVDGT